MRNESRQLAGLGSGLADMAARRWGGWRSRASGGFESGWQARNEMDTTHGSPLWGDRPNNPALTSHARFRARAPVTLYGQPPRHTSACPELKNEKAPTKKRPGQAGAFKSAALRLLDYLALEAGAEDSAFFA